MAFASAPIASPALSQFCPPLISMKVYLIVMFGTKRPFVTSMWIQSTPAASTTRTFSARRPKSADKIDDATMMGMRSVAFGMAAPALNAFHPGLAQPHKYP